MNESSVDRLIQSICKEFGIRRDEKDLSSLRGISDRLLSFRQQDFSTGLGLSILSFSVLDQPSSENEILKYRVSLGYLLETLNIDMTGYDEFSSEKELEEIREFAKRKREMLKFVTYGQIVVVCEWLRYIKSTNVKLNEEASEALKCWEKLLESRVMDR